MYTYLIILQLRRWCTYTYLNYVEDVHVIAHTPNLSPFFWFPEFLSALLAPKPTRSGPVWSNETLPKTVCIWRDINCVATALTLQDWKEPFSRSCWRTWDHTNQNPDTTTWWIHGVYISLTGRFSRFCFGLGWDSQKSLKGFWWGNHTDPHFRLLLDLLLTCIICQEKPQNKWLFLCHFSLFHPHGHHKNHYTNESINLRFLDAKVNPKNPKNPNLLTYHKTPNFFTGVMPNLQQTHLGICRIGQADRLPNSTGKNHRYTTGGGRNPK